MSDYVICNTRLRLMDEASRYRDQMLRDSGEKALTRWECDRGHRWDRTVGVAQNVRCMNCTAERLERETKRLREVAQVRGGALLSRRYVDAATPLRWTCAYGHVWDALPDKASRHWCVECAESLFADFR
ncbi:MULTISPECIES: hypothetical protein [Caballeronia]|jgi:hypothetical protein|uniref:Zinc-ribbon domain-containing protein n=3 Tax=Caballeronia TaxID=1827195 RepID=A0AA37I756_9BURK|nr:MULTISPECIES: hypothetical protein [Caballeronia]MBC8640515.1 hypothetical protein [Caballeronia sp. EK]GJH18912.1 hypothetical protein CBA19CS22_20240 [Caballeronia novacaledonica]GJH23454.1 hypothetical protein CBA19CS42_03080 [Caballeronia novacaledonica]